MTSTSLIRRSLGLGLAALPLLALFVYVLMRSGPLAPVAVTRTTVESRALEPQIAGIGTVDARQVHKIGPIVAGRLLRVEVQPGDAVEAGQVLAELDPVDLDQRLDALRAGLRRAEAAQAEQAARLAYAVAQDERYERLYATRVVSEEQRLARRQERLVAEAAGAAARQEIARARAEVQVAESQRDHLLLRAPVSGIVVARAADSGTTVVAGQAVVELIDPAEIWIDARFDQVHARGLAAGLPARIELRSREGEFQAGSVVRVEPMADTITEETVAKIRFEVALQPLPPLGEIVQLTVQLPPLEAAPSLPSAALRRVDGVVGVWKLVDDGIRFVPVRIGRSDLDGWVQVLDGLAVGDDVVLYSAARLSAGSRIREVASLTGAAP
jgi:HlyD family secretion protein